MFILLVVPVALLKDGEVLHCQIFTLQNCRFFDGQSYKSKIGCAFYHGKVSTSLNDAMYFSTGEGDGGM